MGLISLQMPVLGQPNSTEDAKIISDFTALQNLVNTNIESTNLAPGVALLLRVTGTNRSVAFGSATFSWLAGSGASDAHTIAHGLGVAPAAYFGLLETTSTTSPFVMQTTQIADSTNLYLYGATSTLPGAPFSIKGYWMAIG